ncbi:MAG: hypothetical protein ACI4PF_04485, partial [Christensenellales bacterium]
QQADMVYDEMISDEDSLSKYKEKLAKGEIAPGVMPIIQTKAIQALEGIVGGCKTVVDGGKNIVKAISSRINHRKGLPAHITTTDEIDADNEMNDDK